MGQRYGGKRKGKKWRGCKIVFEMGGGDREVYSGVYGQGGITKQKIKRKGGYESVGIQKKTEGGKERAGQVVLGRRKKQD